MENASGSQGTRHRQAVDTTKIEAKPWSANKASKWRQDALLQPILYLGNRGRERLNSDLLNSTWEMRGKARDLQFAKPRCSQATARQPPSPLLYPILLLLPLTDFFYLHQGFHTTIALVSWFFFISLLNLVYNMIYWAPCHTLDQSMSSFKEKQWHSGQGELTPSCPDVPIQTPHWVTARTTIAWRKATVNSNSADKPRSPWTQWGFISTERNQKYIGWRKLGKSEMRSILPLLPKVPGGAQTV